MDAFQAAWGLGDCGCGCAGSGACGGKRQQRGMGFSFVEPGYGDPGWWGWDNWWESLPWSGGWTYDPGLYTPTLDPWTISPPVFDLDPCGRLVGNPQYGQVPCPEAPSPCGEGYALMLVTVRRGDQVFDEFRCMPAPLDFNTPITQLPTCSQGTVDAGSGRCCPQGWVLVGGTQGECRNQSTGQRMPSSPQSQQSGSGGSGVPRVTATPQQQCAAAGKIYDAARNQCVQPPAGTTIQQLCQASGLPYNAQLNSCYVNASDQSSSGSMMWLLLGAAALMMLR